MIYLLLSIFFCRNHGQFYPGSGGNGAVQLFSDCESVPSVEMCNNAVDKGGRHCSWDIEGMKCNDFGSSDYHIGGWHPPMFGFGDFGNYGMGADPMAGNYAPPQFGDRGQRSGGKGVGNFPFAELLDLGGFPVPEAFGGLNGPPKDNGTPTPTGECGRIVEIAVCNESVDRQGNHCSWFFNENKCKSFVESGFAKDYPTGGPPQSPESFQGPTDSGRPWRAPRAHPQSKPSNPYCPKYRLMNAHWEHDWNVHDETKKTIAEQTEGPTFLSHMAVACSRFDRHECTMQVACAWYGEKETCGPFVAAESEAPKKSKQKRLKSIHRSEHSTRSGFSGFAVGFLSMLFLLLGVLLGRLSRTAQVKLLDKNHLDHTQTFAL